jgi:NAD(P)-dependent dehydrogenase (short-subunit alcohol dehydrogenase family)
VTDGTGGLGFETALALAVSGAEVILTGRHDRKGQSAVDKIRRDVNGANEATNISIWSVLYLLPNSRSGCAPGSLDLLIDNAGVTASGVPIQTLGRIPRLTYVDVPGLAIAAISSVSS